MAFFTVLVLALGVLGYTHGAFVDTLNKCSIKDSDCQKNLIHKVIQDIAENGLEEYKITSIDPIKLENVDVSIPNVINMTLVDGTARGVKNCVINKFETLIEKSKSIIEITCDIIVKGHYRVASNSPVFKNLLGGDMHGDGEGKVKIDKINIKIEYFFKLTKKGDDIFFQRDGKKSKYSWDIKEKVTFAANNLYLGDKESSKQVIGILNENWKIIVGSFGGQFLEFAMKLVYKFLEHFFSRVPAKYYISDDLSQYL